MQRRVRTWRSEARRRLLLGMRQVRGERVRGARSETLRQMPVGLWTQREQDRVSKIAHRVSLFQQPVHYCAYYFRHRRRRLHLLYYLCFHSVSVFFKNLEI